ncbi:MAG: hypothetical protein LBE35_04670 [Clostridiales bacterium]|jgi:hypothetical protein|nr:hypothetical protein [Clostridiales bacterium]
MRERIWINKAIMMFPQKWIVMVNEGWDGTGRNMSFGEIYAVTDTRDEAREIIKSLDDGFENVSIVEGYDPTPQIGGVWACDR